MEKNVQVTPKMMHKLIKAQRSEATEALVYRRILKFVKNENNKNTISQIAHQEELHQQIWHSYTGKDVKPNRIKVWFYVNLIRFLGLTFGIKLMERDERKATIDYEEMSQVIPDAKQIQQDEIDHENQLTEMIRDKPLDYLGSVVLGLNDALVELTGVLAGLTFGLQNSRMIAFVGIITGVSAAFSMSGSEYLSTKTDGGDIKPITASIYTGIAYLLTVIALILPYFFLSNVYWALTVTILVAIIIIAIFNFYTSVAKGYNFKSRFLEMLCISLGVAFISFIVGLIVKQVFGIEVG